MNGALLLKKRDSIKSVSEIIPTVTKATENPSKPPPMLSIIPPSITPLMSCPIPENIDSKPCCDALSVSGVLFNTIYRTGAPKRLMSPIPIRIVLMKNQT